MAETLAHHRYFGIPIQEAMPRTFVAVDARLQSVLDMRDGRVRQRLQIAESQVLELDWRKESRRGLAPVTHRLGRAAHAAGLEGLIVPSTADLGQFNLLVFPDLLGSDSRFKVVNADQLK